MAEAMPPGPIMLDVAGCRLTEEELATLRHPLVGAVILFSRNFESVAQLIELTTEIHALRNPLLIAVDHEGGRVQRFRTGFTAIPPMRSLGHLWDTDPDAANEMAYAAGHVLAAELRACGVDFSFTPVLDLDYGTSQVIGDRAFHRDPRAVTELARSLISGLRRGGMANCGKHFPGHGFVAADSHHAIPYDPRSARDLAEDLEPYRAHHRIDLSAVMPAHVIYEQVAPQPAGFSPIWLQQTLRGEIGFDGVIFSDDLCMEGACVAGDIVARAEAARRAGCDMVLVCNNPEAARRLLGEWRPAPDPRSAQRIASLFPSARPGGRDGLLQDAAYRSSALLLSALVGG